MSDKDEKAGTARRGFLKLAGLGTAGGAAAALSSGTVLADEPEPEAGSRYTETEHVRLYYELARF